MIKDIVVNLALGDGREVIAEFAVSAAVTLDAHVTGVAFVYEPSIPPVEMAVVPADILEAQRVENERLATQAVARFEETARRNAVSFETRRIDDSMASAPETLARIARRFDLSIVAQPHPDGPGIDDLFVESALFSSGRPVLIVPYIQRSPLSLDRVLVCWDGSRTAARATADALPLLARARTVEVVTVTGPSHRDEEIPGIDFAQHLARHGIRVELKRIVQGDIDIASAILSHAADVSADLIVMGGYGHSRWREFVLGGATRGLLKSMTVPTLMSH